jgi:hypothetical protein
LTTPGNTPEVLVTALEALATDVDNNKANKATSKTVKRFMVILFLVHSQRPKHSDSVGHISCIPLLSMIVCLLQSKRAMYREGIPCNLAESYAVKNRYLLVLEGCACYV